MDFTSRIKSQKQTNQPPFSTDHWRTLHINWDKIINHKICATDFHLSFPQFLYNHPKSWCDDEYNTHHHHQTSKNRNKNSNNNNKNCKCLDPTKPHARVPSSPQYFQAWDDTFERNQRMANQKIQQQQQQQQHSFPPPPFGNVLLLGDSITEHWLGTDLGSRLTNNNNNNNNIQHVFEEVFDTQQVLPMGIAGDRSPQLLYRIQNGILKRTSKQTQTQNNDDDSKTIPKNPSNPDIIWLLIGTNDFSDGCGPYAVLRGQLEIVASLRYYHPQARIVVQGLLPRPNPKGLWDTYYYNTSVHDSTRYYDKIQWINGRLRCLFSQNDDTHEENVGEMNIFQNVEYFDPDPYFVTREEIPDERLGDGNNRTTFVARLLTVPKDILPDGLHPSAKASRIWGKAMATRIEQILSERH